METIGHTPDLGTSQETSTLPDGTIFWITEGSLEPYPYIRHCRRGSHIVSVNGADYPMALRAHLPLEIGAFIWEFELAVNEGSQKSLVYGTGPRKAYHLVNRQSVSSYHDRRPYNHSDSPDLEIMPLRLRFNGRYRLSNGTILPGYEDHQRIMMDNLTTGGADYDSKSSNFDPHRAFKRAVTFLKERYGDARKIELPLSIHAMEFTLPYDPSIHENVATVAMYHNKLLHFTKSGLEPVTLLRVAPIPNNRAMTFLELTIGLRDKKQIVHTVFKAHMTPLPQGKYVDLRMDPAVNSYQAATAAIDRTAKWEPEIRFSDSMGVTMYEPAQFLQEACQSSTFALADLIRGIRGSLQRDAHNYSSDERETFRNLEKIKYQQVHVGDRLEPLSIASPMLEHMNTRVITHIVSYLHQHQQEPISKHLATELSTELSVWALQSPLAFAIMIQKTGLYKLLKGFRDFKEEDMAEYVQQIDSHTVKLLEQRHIKTQDSEGLYMMEAIPKLIGQSGNLRVSWETAPTGIEISISSLEAMKQTRGLDYHGPIYTFASRWLDYTLIANPTL